jgi:hypothetical protein
MDLENAAASAAPQSGVAVDAVAEPAPRPRRRRKAKRESAAAAATVADIKAAPAAESERKPEIKPVPSPMPAAALAATPSPRPAAPATPGHPAAPRAISVLPPASEQRKPAAAGTKPSFIKRHGALAAGMVLALGLGSYAGTQLGFERSGDTAAAQGVSVNVAAALPWKREVALASTQTREIARLKEELRTVRTQVDALKSNPDQARQAQELRSLRASVESLKENLTTARADTANAIAQVAQSPKYADQPRLEKIVERIDRLERQVADPMPVAAVQKSEPPKPVALPDPHALPTPADIAAAGQKVEIRPKVIQNYVLREVADGVALIEGPDGLREVWPGRGIPGAGKVTSIEKQAGKWVVITSEGLIEYRRDAYLRN